MKVIGKKSSQEYIIEVDHGELEKYLDRYYGKLNTLEVGKEIDLGKGHDFADDVRRMLIEHKSVLEKSAKVIKTITEGITFLGLSNEL